MYKQVSYKEIVDLIRKENVAVVDVRDKKSFDHEHIPGAIHLSVTGLNDFCQTTSLDRPILVYCYHGISSQSVAQYLVDQGFVNVYSLVGGFELWKSQHTTSDGK